MTGITSPLRSGKRFPAPRMPKQHHLVEMKMLSDLIEIRHFRFERNVFRLHVIGRAAAPALVVIDEMGLVGEAVQLRQKIGDVEVWATMQDDDGRAPPDFAAIQPTALNRDAALVPRSACFELQHLRIRRRR